MNIAAIERLENQFSDLDIVFLESGGDNLAATFSPELVDLTIYTIDVAGGDKIPRKGGPGIVKSDLLVINKIDLAPYVGADLGIMERDTIKMRGDKPFIFTNLKTGIGLAEVVKFVSNNLGWYFLAGDAPDSLLTRHLETIDLIVSAIGLGWMGMSDFYSDSDEAMEIATIPRAWDLSVKLLNTAEFYRMGQNEKLIGRAIREALQTNILS